MTIYKKLLQIQNELKCPKNLYNKFGNYSYRSAENILENVKPLCIRHSVVLVLDDEIQTLGTRYYVKATATLYDAETGEKISNSAYAREEENKKGMDGSQITGSCSSYARKYALNGLFCLDDVKDADSMDNSEETKKASTKYATNEQIEAIKKLNIDFNKMLAHFEINTIEELTQEQAIRIIAEKSNV